MANGFPSAGLQFLRDLAANNDKEWFQANKKRYERELKGPARELVAAVNGALETISPAHVTPPNKAVNRINRDIRFSKDKTPYNTHVWAGFMNHDRPKGAGAGFYFGFDADGLLGVGAGVWMPPKDRMTALRQHFAEHHAAFFDLMGGLSDTFGDVRGEAYKRVPKPWDADHPAAELLKLKGVHLRAELPGEVVTSDAAVSTIAEHFERLVPFVRYLDDGLAP